MTDANKHVDKSDLEVFDRRSTIKALAMGSVALFAGAGIATPANAQYPPMACVQEGWRYCGKCHGMFYGLASASQGGLGVCPAGGAHTMGAGSGFYYERVGVSVTGVQQGGWSWCAKCMGFFYSLASSGMGKCPAGANHINAGSLGYAAVLGGDTTGQQGGWRLCGKCMGMFHPSSSQGVCPAGGTHNGGGSEPYASLN